MSILKTEQKYVKKYLTNNNFIRVISLSIALLLFFSLNSNIFNDIFKTTEYIDAVPLTVEYDEDNYIVKGVPETIAVQVSGSEASVQSAMQSKDNLTAKLIITTDSEGTKKINLNNSVTFSKIGDVSLKPVLSSLDVDVQKRIEAEKTIEYEYVNMSSLSTGYSLEEPILSQSTVKYYGGSQDIESIDSIKALIDISEIEGTTEGQATLSAKLVPYDAEGNVVDIELETDAVEVTQNYTTSIQTIPVVYTFTNIPQDKYITGVCRDSTLQECENVDFSTQESYKVDVFGDKETIESLQSIEYKIDLSDAIDSSYEGVAKVSLPNNVYTLDDQKEQNVVVLLDSGITKTITDIPVRKENLKTSLSAQAVDAKNATVTVEVTGSPDVVNAMNSDSIGVYIDLSEITDPGDYSMPVKYNVTNKYVDVKLSTEWIDIVVTEAEEK